MVGADRRLRPHRLLRAAGADARRGRGRRGRLLPECPLADLRLLRPQRAHQRAVGVFLRALARLPRRLGAGRLPHPALRLARRAAGRGFAGTRLRVAAEAHDRRAAPRAGAAGGGTARILRGGRARRADAHRAHAVCELAGHQHGHRPDPHFLRLLRQLRVPAGLLQPRVRPGFRPHRRGHRAGGQRAGGLRHPRRRLPDRCPGRAARAHLRAGAGGRAAAGHPAVPRGPPAGAVAPGRRAAGGRGPVPVPRARPEFRRDPERGHGAAARHGHRAGLPGAERARPGWRLALLRHADPTGWRRARSRRMPRASSGRHARAGSPPRAQRPPSGAPARRPWRTARARG